MFPVIHTKFENIKDLSATNCPINFATNYIDISLIMLSLLRLVTARTIHYGTFDHWLGMVLSFFRPLQLAKCFVAIIYKSEEG